MATQLVYKNIFGNTITLQQAQQLGEEYHQEQLVNGVLKRIDDYSSNGEINSGTYYLSEGEDLQAFLSSVADLWYSAYIYTNSAVNGVYTIYDWEIYVGLNKVQQGQTAYDQQGREIAEQKIDINTGQVIKMTKIYYLTEFGRYNNNDDVRNFGTFKFNYNFPGLSDNEIAVLVNLPGYDNKQYIISDTENILLDASIAEIFSWDNETYYHSATPFIPGKAV